ncbi:MAG: hypothetical protein WC842_02560 [Candidatus Paceibacterota bacterium]|jgi:hypothetical protein
MSTQKVVYCAEFTRQKHEAYLYVAGSKGVIKKFEGDIGSPASLINEIINYIETERMAEVLSFSFSPNGPLFILAKVFS